MIVICGAGCRIRSKAPYWLETHGHALGNRVVGWSGGALLLGGDRNLWGYPGPWSNPWILKAQAQPLRAIAGANAVAYGLFSDGQVSRFAGERWQPYPGSAAWRVSELAAAEDDHLFVIADGKLRIVEHGELTALSCDAITSVAVAGTRAEQAFVLDRDGALYLNDDGRCDPIAAPARLQRIAARSDRLLAVAIDGSVWRRRGRAWTRLPRPFKYRSGQSPALALAQDVGVSAYSTWLVDTEGSVFLLSDES